MPNRYFCNILKNERYKAYFYNSVRLTRLPCHWKNFEQLHEGLTSSIRGSVPSMLQTK